ncbi:unnamed protein product [Strongylus vulgaris]|uniref:Uncharacterized protein n=1 Tax=Strongylus vulgaris TaxID=40348 RepID=A0A3P7K6S8_STRVU|nr:unnamed protein product [Strongylus vulgaris]
MKTIRMGAEAFIYYDRIMLAINEKQDYVLMKYIPIFYMLLHAAVATHTRAKLKYPQLEQSASQRRRESEETLATLQSGLLARHSPSALIYDVLPLIVQIVQPPIKAITLYLATGKSTDENAPPTTNTTHIKELVANAKATAAAAKTSQTSTPSRPLFYKYNTGCSTAVKRTIRMHQLLG